MLDIRLLREDPTAVKERLATRSGQYADLIDQILACDARRRESETRVQHLRAEKTDSARKSDPSRNPVGIPPSSRVK